MTKEKRFKIRIIILVLLSFAAGASFARIFGEEGLDLIQLGVMVLCLTATLILMLHFIWKPVLDKKEKNK